MPPRRILVTLAAVALAVAAASGCGSSKQLPRDIPSASAGNLVTTLNDVVVACQKGDPAAVRSAAQAYAQALAALPSTVNADVRKVLTQTSDNLSLLAQDPTQCAAGPTGASGAQGVAPTNSTSTPASTTPTTPTGTTPTATTLTNTTPTNTTPASGPPGGGKPGSGSGGVGAGKDKKPKKHPKGLR